MINNIHLQSNPLEDHNKHECHQNRSNIIDSTITFSWLFTFLTFWILFGLLRGFFRLILFILFIRFIRFIMTCHFLFFQLLRWIILRSWLRRNIIFFDRFSRFIWFTRFIIFINISFWFYKLLVSLVCVYHYYFCSMNHLFYSPNPDFDFLWFSRILLEICHLRWIPCPLGKQTLMINHYIRKI